MIHLVHKTVGPEALEDVSRPLEWLCRSFAVTEGDEAAGESEMGLALLKHEAVVGPALSGYSVEVARFSNLSLNFEEYGLACQSGVLVPDGTHICLLNHDPFRQR